MRRSLKNKGSIFERRFKPPQGGTSHAEKIKNIERMIIADFKTNFYQGVFYGFSK